MQPLGLLVDPLEEQPHQLHERDQEAAEGEAAQVEAYRAPERACNGEALPLRGLLSEEEPV